MLGQSKRMTASAHPARTSLKLLAAAAMLASAMSAAAADSQTDDVQVWVSRDTGPGEASEKSAGMVLNPDGKTLYVVGDSGGQAIVIAHEAATGARVWAVRVKDRQDLADFSKAVTISPDGTRLFVTGQS